MQKILLTNSLVIAYSQETCKVSHLKLYYHYKLETKFYSDINIDKLLATKSESKKLCYKVMLFLAKKEENVFSQNLPQIKCLTYVHGLVNYYQRTHQRVLSYEAIGCKLVNCCVIDNFETQVIRHLALCYSNRRGIQIFSLRFI